MISRKKQSDANSAWQPFATSTPLRIMPDKTKTNGSLQKQYLKPQDVKNLLLQKTFKTLNNGESKQVPEQTGQITKKFKRNRSNFYFTRSSSSSEDEDCLSSNGPTIKINVEGSTHIKSSLKNGDSKKKILASPKSNNIESNQIVVDNGVNSKIENKGNFVETDLPNKEINANNKATENCKPDVEVTTTQRQLENEMKHPRRSKNNSYDHEDKHKENTLNKKKDISQDKSNKSGKNSKKLKGEMVDLNGCERNSFKESSFLDSAPTLKHDKSSEQHNLHPQSKKDVKIKSQSSPESVKAVACKLKRTKSPINADPIEKKRVKNAERLSNDNKSPTDKKKTKLKIQSLKKDSSHQLFSDSMHQELINSLDLTTAELDNLDQVFESPWKMTPNKTLPKRNKPKGKAVKNINFSPKRSARQRQPPKEFWMPRNQCDMNKGTDVSKENNSEKGDTVSSSQYPDLNEAQNKKNDALEKAEEGKGECIKEITKKVKIVSKTKKLGFAQKFQNNKFEKDEGRVQVDENKENKGLMDGDNFKNTLSLATEFPGDNMDISFFEDCMGGVQAIKCWSLKNFKCGILRIRHQCQISDKTIYKNSYFGGVLMRGSVKMRIDKKDVMLSEEDMAFVGPLAEWSMTGDSESDSLFYYWCGRFKA